MSSLPQRVIDCLNLYQDGMSCHKAVTEIYHVDSSNSLKITDVLYKILGNRRTCGAIIGALKVIDNYDQSLSIEDKKEMTARLIMRCHNELGDLSCGVLTHYQHDVDFELELLDRTNIKYFKSCAILVAAVMNILEEIIAEHQGSKTS
jgi:hypothetical protein